MEALKKKLEEKKRAMAVEKEGGGKYRRRGDLEKEKQEQQLAADQALAPAPATNGNGNGSANGSTAAPAVAPLQAPPTGARQPRLPRAEVIKRLRAFHQPVTLFGETDLEREIRMEKLSAETEASAEFEGQRNDMAEEIERLGEADKHEKKKENVYLDVTIPPGHQEPQNDGDYIIWRLQNWTRLWEADLEEQGDSFLKKTAQGKMAIAIFKQTQKAMLPLYRSLQTGSAPADVVHSIREIINSIVEREYLKANDAYLRLAIGNAPWPMGVTMVGIHERSAREKIFSNSVAHILNDETQRKYIQGLKRIMTFCQRVFPAAPSKCMG
jgi:pre-mRNA-splicing factor 18